MTEKTVDEIKSDAIKAKAENEAKAAEELKKIESQNLEIVEGLKATMEIVKPTNSTLFKKMAVVMTAVKRVPKNGWNSFHKYAYPTETDLLEAVRDILAEAGLALLVSVKHSKRELLPIHDKFNPTMPEKTKMKWFTKIEMEFTLGCTDTGVEKTVTFHGEGQDDDDKGLYKAYTNTLKYFLRQTFLIPTGDVQPEADGQPMDVEYDKKQREQPSNAQNQPNNNNQANTPNNNQKPKNDPQTVTYEKLVEKWKSIGGTNENFTPFYDKQIKENKNHGIIDRWLDGKIADRAKAQKEQAELKMDEPKK